MKVSSVACRHSRPDIAATSRGGVEIVAKNGVADVLQVQTQLVAATSPWREFESRPVAEPFDDLPSGL